MINIFEDISKSFSGLKIKTKIVVGLLSILFLFLIFSFTILWTVLEISRCQSLTEFSLRSVSFMRLARINEKDFFKNYDLKNIEENGKSIELLLSNLKSVSKLEKNKEFVSNIEILQKLTLDYCESLNKVVSLLIEKGLNEKSGVLGLLRVKTKELETLIQKNSSQSFILFYKVVKYEKDYEQFKNNEYIDSFNNDIAILELQLKNNQEALNLLNDYRSTFYKLISLDNQINGEIIEFNNYIGKIEPGLSKYNIYINNFVYTVKIRALVLIFIIFVVILFVGVISGVITTKSISHPIRQISKSSDLVKGLTLFLSNAIKNNINETKKLTCLMEDVDIVLGNQSETYNKSSDSFKEFNEVLSIVNNTFLDERKKIEKINTDIIENTGKNELLMKGLQETKEFTRITLDTLRFITEISHNLKLLAFNANVEMPQGGENARFVRNIVIELRKISDKSNESAKIFSEIINRNLKNFEQSIDKNLSSIDNYTIFMLEIEKQNNSIIEMIGKVKAVSQNYKIIYGQFKSLNDINDKIKFSRNELKIMVMQINQNLNNLMDVKQKTNDTIHDILEDIKNIADDNDNFDDIEEIQDIPAYSSIHNS
jgi:methyl-accepting chemotaxis protein